MIRLHVPGFFGGDFSGGNTRLGDAQIIDDGKHFEVIDGNCGAGTTRLIKALKDRNIRSPYLHMSHAHYDHRYGIRKIINDKWFTPKALYCQDPASIKPYNNAVKSDIEALRVIISEAKAREIPVIFLKNGQSITHGEIKFICYREEPAWDGNAEGYLNDGSLAYWFPELRYLTTGDAGMWCVNKYGLKPIFIKCGHHGNNIGDEPHGTKPSVMARRLKNNGCLFYWDNDYSVGLNDFLMTGREDAQNAGMTIFDIHGDINAMFHSGKGVIYKDGRAYGYSCDYKAPLTLKKADLDIVVTVLKGNASTNDARTTYLLNKGYRPVEVQNAVNTIYKLVKG